MKFLECPWPKYQESLANYLDRIATYNYCPKEWLFKELGIERIYKKDMVNLINDENLLQLIAYLTRKDKNVIKELTFNKYNIGLWDINKKAEKEYHFNNHINLINSKVCPLCMREDKYERTYWHLKQLKLCVKHNTLLIDSCNSCNKELNTNDIVNGRCSCGMTVSENPIIYCNDSMVIQNQRRLYLAFHGDCPYEVIDKKYISRLKGINYIRLIEFLNRLLLSIICYLEDINYLQRPIEHELQGVRHILYLEHVLSDWPDNFINILDLIFSNKSMKKQVELEFLFNARKEILIHLVCCTSKDAELIEDTVLNQLKRYYSSLHGDDKLIEYFLQNKLLTYNAADYILGNPIWLEELWPFFKEFTLHKDDLTFHSKYIEFSQFIDFLIKKIIS